MRRFASKQTAGPIVGARRHVDVGTGTDQILGYVERAQSAPNSKLEGTKVDLMVRGKPVPAEIVPMPFVKHAYYRG